jgi:hypothetical protein
MDIANFGLTSEDLNTVLTLTKIIGQAPVH